MSTRIGATITESVISPGTQVHSKVQCLPDPEGVLADPSPQPGWESDNLYHYSTQRQESQGQRKCGPQNIINTV